MWAWIINAFRVAAPGAIGYFINDIGDAVDKFIPEGWRDKIRGKDGGLAWWFIALLFLMLGGVVMVVLKLVSKGGKRGKMFSILLGLGAAFSFYYGAGEAGFILGTALVTLTTGAGVVTSQNMNFVPERIWFSAGTQLTGIKVSVQEDGTVFDSSADGLTHIGVNRIIGQVTNAYVITLATGLMKNKNVLLEFTNSAAQTPIIYYDSDSTPKNVGNDIPLYLQMMKVPLLIGGNDFTDFATLSLPSLAAGDSITILYKDGTIQANMSRADLQMIQGFKQTVVNTPIYMVDNLDQNIKSVTVNCLAAQTGFLQRAVASVSRGVVAGQLG